MVISSKEEALRIIQRMPDDATLEEIIYRRYFRQRVDRGLQELEEGRTISHAEQKRSFAG